MCCHKVTASKIHSSSCIHPQTHSKNSPLFSSISAWHGPFSVGRIAWRKDREPSFAQQHHTLQTSPHSIAGVSYDAASEPYDLYEQKKQHRSDVIKAAVDYVLQSGLPAYRVCTMFNIPQATLYRHLTKAQKLQNLTVSGTTGTLLAGPADQASRDGTVTHFGGEADALSPGKVQTNRGEVHVYPHSGTAGTPLAGASDKASRGGTKAHSGGEADTVAPGEVQPNRGDLHAYTHGPGAVQTLSREAVPHRGRDVKMSDGGAHTYLDNLQSQSEKVHSHDKGFREYSSEGHFKSGTLDLGNESSVDLAGGPGEANRLVGKVDSRDTAELGGDAPGSQPVVDLGESSDELPDSDPKVKSKPVKEQRQTETSGSVDSAYYPGP